MKASSRGVVLPLCCWTIAAHSFAAELKKPGPSPSDALFDPSRVIQIEIRMDPKDWHALRISHPVFSEDGNQVIARGYEYYRADVVIDGQLVKSVGVRKKGTGSESAIRPAFKIKFDEYVKNQEFSGLEMLTLNTLSWDPSKAQQSLVHSFLIKAGAITPRSNLARVMINGEDLGIYGHVESIDKQFIKRHFGNAKGDLYEGLYGADFTTNAFNKLTHKWGKDADLAQVRKLVDVLESPGPVSLKSVEVLVDLDAFITYWAATVLISNGDSYPMNVNNYYVYRDAKSGKFFWFTWGADAWGLAANFQVNDIPRSVWAGAFLCRRLWELPEVRERYRKEMRRLLAEVWSENVLLAELEQIKQLRRDDLPYRAQSGGWPLRKDFDFFVARPYERKARFIEGQRKAVQAELDRPAVDWPLPRKVPEANADKPKGPPMLVEGSFTAVVAEGFPTNNAGFFGQGTAKVQFTVAGETRKPFARSGAVAVLRNEMSDEHDIRLVTTDDAGALTWRIRFRMEPYRAPLAPGPRELGGFSGVMAPLWQGKQGRQGPDNTGTLELTQVSTNLGGTISGNFKINTTAFEEEKKP